VNGAANERRLAISGERKTKMMRRLIGVGLVVVTFTAPAFGQPANRASPGPGNPAGIPPGTIESAPGDPAARQTNQPDRTFIHAATIGGLAEVDLGKLATQKGAGRAVKDFAQLMVRDHGTANDRLAGLAKADGVMLPDKFDEEHRILRGQLEQLSGARFDQAYIQGQISDHQKSAQLLEYEIGSGENPDLKAFASDILPMVLEHLRMGQGIAAELSQQAEATSKDNDQQKR
jgi:putative membrane protein